MMGVVDFGRGSADGGAQDLSRPRSLSNEFYGAIKIKTINRIPLFYEDAGELMVALAV